MPALARCSDSLAVNALLNHPAIRPTVGGEGYLDASTLLADPRNVCLVTEDGGGLFRWSGPGVFDFHVFMLVRGRAAIELAKQMLALMAEAFGAKHVWACVPKAARNVQWFARKIGMRSLGSIDAPDGQQQLFEMRF